MTVCFVLQFCGAKATDKDDVIMLLPISDRISAADFSETRTSNHVLVDVRTEPELNICSLENSINIPMADLEKEETLKKLEQMLSDDSEIVIVCRRGNDSQFAVQTLREKLNGRNILIRDIVGGLHSWARSVDPTFPVY